MLQVKIEFQIIIKDTNELPAMNVLERWQEVLSILNTWPGVSGVFLSEEYVRVDVDEKIVPSRGLAYLSEGFRSLVPGTKTLRFWDKLIVRWPKESESSIFLQAIQNFSLVFPNTIEPCLQLVQGHARIIIVYYNPLVREEKEICSHYSKYTNRSVVFLDEKPLQGPKHTDVKSLAVQLLKDNSTEFLVLAQENSSDLKQLVHLLSRHVVSCLLISACLDFASRVTVFNSDYTEEFPDATQIVQSGMQDFCSFTRLPQVWSSFAPQIQNYFVYRQINPIKVLGSGTYSSVVLVKTHQGNEQATKLNFISRDLFRKTGVPSYYLRELDILSKTNCPFLSEAFHPMMFFMDDFYLLSYDMKPSFSDMFQFINNPDLYQSNIHEVVSLMYQCLTGLVGLHQNNVMHRDIKPANILLYKNPDGRLQAKLTDFNLSVSVVSSQGKIQRFKTSKVYTNSYRPPEIQALDRPGVYDFKADVYALAKVFLEMALGRIVHQSTSLQISARSFFQLFQPKAGVANVLNSRQLFSLCDLLSKCLQPAPQHRLSSTQMLNHPFWTIVTSQDPQVNAAETHTNFRSGSKFLLSDYKFRNRLSDIVTACCVKHARNTDISQSVLQAVSHVALDASCRYLKSDPTADENLVSKVAVYTASKLFDVPVILPRVIDRQVIELEWKIWRANNFQLVHKEHTIAET